MNDYGKSIPSLQCPLTQEQLDQLFGSIKDEAMAIFTEELQHQRGVETEPSRPRIVVICPALDLGLGMKAAFASIGAKVVEAAEAMQQFGERVHIGDPMPGRIRKHLNDLALMDEANILDACGADPRPIVARPADPMYHDPRLLRLDANSRKYQSTQKNWRKFDGSHHKKKKIIKGR